MPLNQTKRKIKMATTLFGVMPGKISAQILAVKSFYAPENSAPLLNAFSEDGTMLSLLKRKSDLRQSLAHFNQPSPTSDILPKNGKTIVLKKGYWVSPLPAF